MSDSRKTIRIYKGGEYRTLVSTIYWPDAFFYSAYQQAAHVITEIVLESEKFLERQNPQKDTEDHYSEALAYMRGENTMNETSQILGYPNNIVAFCGHRGQGKSSAMLSMSKALELMPQFVGSQDHEGKVFEFWNSEDVVKGFENSLTGDNPVRSKRFIVLEPIDPTLMGKETSILRCIISKMYTRAFEEGKNRPSRYSSAAAYNQEHFGRPWQQPYDQKVNEEEWLQGELTMDFLKCFHSLETMEGAANQTQGALSDDLTELAEKGDSFNLKQQFATLVQHFLNYMTYSPSDERSHNAMLVIQVDDADLNTGNAYGIAEEIRKYCILPQTIVLMALHDESMLRNIEQHFVKEYADMLKNGRMEAEKCHQITGRYFDKLFPGQHQVHLPVINSVVRSDPDSLKLRYLPEIPKEGQTEGDIDLLSFRYPLTARRKVFIGTQEQEQERKPEELDYQERLIMLLYQRTGIILAKPEASLHRFLPSNMRELTHMLAYLDSMHEVVGTKPKDGAAEEEANVADDWLLLLKQFSLSNNKMYKHGVTAIQRRLANLDSFEQYFIHTWCSGCLTREQMEIISNIEITPDERKIRTTLQLLRKFFPDDFKKQEDDSAKDTSHTLSFADVADALLQLAQGRGEEKLQCAVQMYYSIYLNRIALKGLLSWGEKENDKIFSGKAGQRPDEYPFTDLVQFLGQRIFPDSYFEQRKKSHSTQFPFTIEKFPLENANLGARWNQWVAPVDVESEGKSLIHWNENIVTGDNPSHHEKADHNTEGAFDAFRPLLYRIKKFNYDEQVTLEAAANLLHLLCNVDLQFMIYQQYLGAAASKLESKHNSFHSFVKGIYEDLNARMKHHTLMSIEHCLADIVSPTDEDILKEIWNLNLQKDQADYENDTTSS